MTFVAEGVEIKYDRLCLIPLGGQSEIGRVLWAIHYAGEILLVDAGACYPGTELPGVDLLLPNTSFLQANQDRILALVLTNGHEEHCGSVSYLLDHVRIPRIMAPRFVAALLSQKWIAERRTAALPAIDTIETRESYQIGSFDVEWIQVNDAIADACGLRISTPEGPIVYTSSFKLDQTPIDGRQMDIARLAALGDQGVLVLISDSAGVEGHAYTPSERVVARAFEQQIRNSDGRVIVILNGMNTLRMQVLFDLAKQVNRKVVLFGEALIQTAVAAAITGNLAYDRAIEATPQDLPGLVDREVLLLATGEDGDAMALLHELAHQKNKVLSLKRGDTIIFSEDIFPGELRKLAMILDQLLSQGIKSIIGARGGVHVPNHAGREELKLMMSIVRPRFFVPAIGEGRHIMHHAQLAQEFGQSPETIFPLRNGEILEVNNGQAQIIGSVEAEAIFYNRDQEESVTAFSVSERRSLSLDGVLTVGVVVTSDGTIVESPVFEGAALGFWESPEWAELRERLQELIFELATRLRSEGQWDFGSFKSSLRDLVSKQVRSKMSTKPTVIAVVHEIATSRPV